MTDLLTAYNTAQAALAELASIAKRSKCPGLWMEASTAQASLAEALEFDAEDVG